MKRNETKRNYNKYPLSAKLIALIFAIGLVFMCSSAYCQEDCEKVKPASCSDSLKISFFLT